MTDLNRYWQFVAALVAIGISWGLQSGRVNELERSNLKQEGRIDAMIGTVMQQQRSTDQAAYTMGQLDRNVIDLQASVKAIQAAQAQQQVEQVRQSLLLESVLSAMKKPLGGK